MTIPIRRALRALLAWRRDRRERKLFRFAQCPQCRSRSWTSIGSGRTIYTGTTWGRVPGYPHRCDGCGLRATLFNPDGYIRVH